MKGIILGPWTVGTDGAIGVGMMTSVSLSVSLSGPFLDGGSVEELGGVVIPISFDTVTTSSTPCPWLALPGTET